MMLSLTLVLLAAPPAPGHASLLAPDAPPRALSARLMAQVQPPPLPEEPPDESLRIRDLSLQVADLNERIAGIDTGWPGYALALAITGGVLSTALLVSVPLIVLGGFAHSTSTTVLGWGSLGTGLAGVGMLIGATFMAGSAQQQARAERARLVRERDRFEAELNALRARQEVSHTLSRVPPTALARTVPLLALTF